MNRLVGQNLNALHALLKSTAFLKVIQRLTLQEDVLTIGSCHHCPVRVRCTVFVEYAVFILFSLYCVVSKTLTEEGRRVDVYPPPEQRCTGVKLSRPRKRGRVSLFLERICFTTSQPSQVTNFSAPVSTRTNKLPLSGDPQHIPPNTTDTRTIYSHHDHTPPLEHVTSDH